MQGLWIRCLTWCGQPPSDGPSADVLLWPSEKVWPGRWTLHALQSFCAASLGLPKETSGKRVCPSDSVWVLPSSGFAQSLSHSLPRSPSPSQACGPLYPFKLYLQILSVPPPPHTCCFRVSQDGPIPVLSPWPLMLCTVPAWLNSASSQSAHPRMTVTMAGVSSKCKAHVGVCRGESADWRRQERGARGMDRRCQPLGGHGGRWVSSTLSYVTCGFPACR